MICYARNVLAQCIINVEYSLSLSPPPFSHPFHPSPVVSHTPFESLIFHVFSERSPNALSSTWTNRERPSASRNPVGKLIRSDNPEEFDVGLRPLAPCSPLSIGVNPSHIRERLPLIIFSWWALTNAGCLCSFAWLSPPGFHTETRAGRA